MKDYTCKSCGNTEQRHEVEGMPMECANCYGGEMTMAKQEVRCVCPNCQRETDRLAEYIGVAECHACGTKVKRKASKDEALDDDVVSVRYPNNFIPYAVTERVAKIAKDVQAATIAEIQKKAVAKSIKIIKNTHVFECEVCRKTTVQHEYSQTLDCGCGGRQLIKVTIDGNGDLYFGNGVEYGELTIATFALLRQRREADGLTQAQLAELLGCSRQAVTMAETGQRLLTAAMIEYINEEEDEERLGLAEDYGVSFQ